MTKDQAQQKYNELVNQASEAMKKHFEDMWNSGGIEPSWYENDYQLPKIMICAALKEEKYQYEPYTKEDRGVVKNLWNITSFNSTK